MIQFKSPKRLSTKRIALIGHHLPRQCGIATFTTDLLEALTHEAEDADCCAVVMNDKPDCSDASKEAAVPVSAEHHVWTIWMAGNSSFVTIVIRQLITSG
ncbi:MAG: hypothetical protein AMJ65_13940 [Phycisphaerae bacterium SG8_4]|nr:MAG: hypothetical protein AMJ65_13940 [Phycisphaerae bacterium SG8_4]